MEQVFEYLVNEALQQEFSGWDFSWMEGRYYESETFWDYRKMVLERMKNVHAMLDMGTGGGEFLASLPELPDNTVATESYPPNIILATQRLSTLGVQVVAVDDDHALPLLDETFDLVINRHESYDLGEVWRILKPGGVFLTQQVGPRNCVQLNQYLNAPLNSKTSKWKLEQERSAFEEAGFDVEKCYDQILESNFYDIGAVVFYLKVIEWQIEDFSLPKYRQRLLDMYYLIEAQGAFYATEQRFLIEAKKLA